MNQISEFICILEGYILKYFIFLNFLIGDSFENVDLFKQLYNLYTKDNRLMNHYRLRKYYYDNYSN